MKKKIALICLIIVFAFLLLSSCSYGNDLISYSTTATAFYNNNRFTIPLTETLSSILTRSYIEHDNLNIATMSAIDRGVRTSVAQTELAHISEIGTLIAQTKTAYIPETETPLSPPAIITNTSERATAFITSTNSTTPNPTLTLQAAFAEVDKQFTNLLQSNIAITWPEIMGKGYTSNIELILNPSISQSTLAAEAAQQSGMVTSTTDPNLLVGEDGSRSHIETSIIKITPLMKAVLIAQDPDAFKITEMHDSPEQVISSTNTTAWRWSIRAEKIGLQHLELIVYQLIKYGDEDYWHEVEAYKANILVKVTIADRIKSWDWKWIATAILVPLVGGIWGWLRSKKSKERTISHIPQKRSRNL